jgi:zinc transport system substrate-binding protein
MAMVLDVSTKRANRWRVLCLALGMLLVSVACLLPGQVVADSKSIEVFVSILPQKNFVERIGGEHVNVHVMVGPGQSPATYEPTPKQMAKLTRADIYFRVGTPFETVWMDRIAASNPALAIIDARDAITLREVKRNDFLAAPTAGNHDHDHGLKDPHIWTDPLNVKNFMRHFTDKMAVLYPNYATYFWNNYQQFAVQLGELDGKIQAMFQNTPSKHFLVFHPSWGYFADRYGLVQISIELEGKTPNAKELAAVIDYATQHNIKRVFVQKQFGQKDAQAVANAIKGKVVVVDPLAEDYFINLLQVAQKISGSIP